MTDTERLLPCPFCGGPGYLDQEDPGMDRAPPYWFAGCKACGYTLKAVYTAEFIPGRGYVEVPTAKQDAIDAFNRRANKPWKSEGASPPTAEVRLPNAVELGSWNDTPVR